MSSRPFNRVLGETSLELKCLALFGSFLLVVITVSFLLYWSLTETVVRERNPKAARLLGDQVMLTAHWEAFARKDDEESRERFLSVVQALSKDFTYNLRNYTIQSGKQNKAWRFIVPGDADPAYQPQNPFEQELLERFMKPQPKADATEGESDTDERLAESGEFVYYKAVRAQSSCLAMCHVMPPDPGGINPFTPSGAEVRFAHSGRGIGRPLADGDLMAIVSVSISNVETQAALDRYWGILLAVSIITAFLAMIAFYLTIRYVIARPLKHLREVSDSISRGNIAMRADIHTGDEFELLGVAFNRMLGHLVAAQDELRQVNADLDGKVDELAQLNMQLYEMNRIKSDFLATMSHELRTPLNSILGFSDVLGSIDALDEKQKRYVENIQKSGRMLLEMINNILDLAKIESGKMDIRLTDFSIEQVVHAQCDMARPLTEKKNIDLEIEIQPGLPPLYQDQARVQQILNNLLSNAIKFTPEGGRILVGAQSNGRDEVLLRVTDTGVGIAEEDQQVIFEKFRQGATALPGGDAMTREYSGTGLGLSIVKELCKLLEGEVSVQSELGTGSTFTVRLPWRLKKQPRLDSPLVTGFDNFSRPWLDRQRTERITSDPADSPQASPKQ
jgi:signal transduction histidine kinase